ncbi:MAG: ParB N-terminal domain-containing protein [Candidatus Bathyarchaeia archaeon]
MSSEKLDSVMRNLRQTKAIYVEPIPIKKLDNQIVLVDGHTRAFAAFLLGLSEIPVYWEDEELDWDEYRTCVKWCKEEGIITISDLKKRVIPHKDYEVLWLDRCKKMQTDMEIKRKTKL